MKREKLQKEEPSHNIYNKFPQESKPVKCKECGLVFTSKTKGYKHLREIHAFNNYQTQKDNLVEISQK